jgi:uncharacterized protein YggE
VRLAGVGLALALTVSAPAAAQPPAAANEVLLEVNAIGTTTRRADLATFTVSLQAEGRTEAEARSSLAEKTRRLTAAVTAMGVAAADVQAGPIRVEGMDMRTFDVSDEPPPPPEEPPPPPEGEAAAASVAAAAAASSPPRVTQPIAAPISRMSGGASSVSGSLIIRARDMNRVQELRNEVGRVEGSYALYTTSPVFSLADPGTARSEARVRALASARADAESYAAALNMRVARLVRVTDRVGVDLLGLMMGEPGRRSIISGPETTRDGDVVVTVPIGVDFVLAPR